MAERIVRRKSGTKAERIVDEIVLNEKPKSKKKSLPLKEISALETPEED